MQFDSSRRGASGSFKPPQRGVGHLRRSTTRPATLVSTLGGGAQKKNNARTLTLTSWGALRAV
eukprot:9501457-Pyramimonas_sp.AAC.1